MALIESIEELEELYYAGDRSQEDLIVVDREGNEWTVTTDEYDELHVMDDADTAVPVADTYTYYGPSICGAWSVHGPFSTK